MNANPGLSATDISNGVQKARRGRNLRRILLMIVVPAAMIIGGGWFWLTGGRYEATENANLRQARVDISSTVSGRVTDVMFTDNQRVAQGDVLFSVDPEPYRLALTLADAAIAAARLNVEQMKAAYGIALAQQKVAEDEAAYQASELARQESLTAKGVATTSALADARHAERKAREQLATARQTASSALAALGGDPDIPTDQHPAVLAEIAARDRAAYNLSMATVRAPSDGIVYQAASFKPGVFVSVGAPLFSLIETGDSWVEANFKETQLENVLPGQSAEIEFDSFPGQTLTGTVVAIGAGTGAEFSLIPAQNATGNWVKVTQRIPVRVSLESVPPGITLRTGMSAKVRVDTAHTRRLAAFLPTALAGSQASPDSEK